MTVSNIEIRVTATKEDASAKESELDDALPCCGSNCCGPNVNSDSTGDHVKTERK